MDQATHNRIVSFIWGIADDVLRDLFRRGKYPDVILPMCVLRRMDAVLEPTKQAVLDTKQMLDDARITEQRAALADAAGQAFYNTSRFTLRDLRSRGNAQQLLADFVDYWKVTVERPLRLHSQLSLKAIESLRFASGDEELRAALFEAFGDALFNDFDAIAGALEQRLADWGSDDEDAEEEEGGGAKKGLPEKKRKKLLDAKTWERDGRLVDVATALRESLGDALFEDHNVFRDLVEGDLKKQGTKLPAAELKLILKAVSWRVETAPPVIAKVHKPTGKSGKLTADPMLGLYEATRLVADVVTGKLDVREAAAHLPDDMATGSEIQPDEEADDLELIEEEATEA